jgi:F420H(2)-dependent quinone reductase
MIWLQMQPPGHVNDRRTLIDDRIRQTLSLGHTIDITTTGRQSGQPRRIEVVFHNIDGRLYISGMPRRERRSWLANLDADPRMTCPPVRG